MTNKLTLRQLQHVIVLSESQSLREAAATLGITESALGSSISQVEKHVGRPVCVRKRAVGMTMTSAGRRLAEGARDILTRLSDLEDEVSGAPGTLSGTVRCGVSAVLVAELAVELAAVARDDLPGVKLEIRAGLRADLSAGLESGALDIAVMFLADETDTFAYTSISSVPLVLARSAQGSGETRAPLEEALKQPFVLVDSVLGRTIAGRVFEGAGSRPPLTRRAPSLDVALAMVSAGAGFGLFPDIRGLRTAAADRVQLTHLGPPFEPVQIVAAWSHEKGLSAGGEAVRDLLVGIGRQQSSDVAPRSSTMI